MRKHEVATLVLGVAITAGLVMAQDAPTVPELTTAEKTTIKLLQAELLNAQLNVQLFLTRAQAAQAQAQARQAQLDSEILRVRDVKQASTTEFDFNLTSLTFSRKAAKMNE